MRNNILILLVLLILCGAAVWFVAVSYPEIMYSVMKSSQHNASPIVSGDNQNTIPAEVDRILEKRIQSIEELARSEIVVRNIAEANALHQTLSLEEKLHLDKIWRSAVGVDDFIRTFLTNELALHLLEFQETHLGYAEIFITDEAGLNVGQTGKTSDYYQADEDWWVQTYANGVGKVSYSGVELAESSDSRSISLYVPVIDPLSGRAVGVIKAVVDISSIENEL